MGQLSHGIHGELYIGSVLRPSQGVILVASRLFCPAAECTVESYLTYLSYLRYLHVYLRHSLVYLLREQDPAGRARIKANSRKERNIQPRPVTALEKKVHGATTRPSNRGPRLPNFPCRGQKERPIRGLLFLDWITTGMRSERLSGSIARNQPQAHSGICKAPFRGNGGS